MVGLAAMTLVRDNQQSLRPFTAIDDEELSIMFHFH